MFNVVQTPKFTRTVTVHVPHGDGYQEQTFVGHFRAVPEDDYTDTTLGEVEKNKELLRAAWIGGDDFVGDADAPVVWSEDLREALLSRADVRVALLQTYFSAVSTLRPGN
ncbi:hypothetical protein [Thalassovita sp.]|uniref:hypothetical protein n=1 Tax=Thalassovita sp. TaxID=1979401 RepID=UPI002B26B2BB|nr:hypothetical protein [Thalassovita sp.]